MTKVVILAGGRGHRLRENEADPPKPLVEIGGKPILWHVMGRFGACGYTDFIIALGFGAEQVADYLLSLKGSWNIGAAPTPLNCDTAGRLKRLASRLGDDPFILAWCDGVSDVDARHLMRFHEQHGRLATVVAVQPPPRFGYLQLEGDRVLGFEEKSRERAGWINAGIMVLAPEILERIGSDDASMERDTLPALAAAGELMAFRHEGFWDCMDTPADRDRLRKLWQSGEAPWT